jgi:apolipoprotein N-acyltransferase
VSDAFAPSEPRLRRESPRSTAVLLVLSGGALALAFPRFDFSLLAWIALVPVLTVAVRERPRAALGWGWLAGTSFFLALLRWLDFTFRTYSAIPWPLTWLPIAALAGYCGLYTGLVTLGMAWLSRRRGEGVALALAPALWIGGEWIRGWLMGGFPWGLLGYSQYGWLPVIQIAELTGVWGVSFVVVAVNAAVAGLFMLSRRSALLGAVGAGGLLVAVLAFGWWRLVAPPPPTEAALALVQPSIDQPLKWSPGHADATLRTYLALTQEAGRHRPDLIVWPETAAPTVLRQDAGLQQVLEKISVETGAAILVGSIDVSDSPPPRYYNSAFLLDGRAIVGRYDKIQLVPFGEYVPLSGLIGFVRSWAEFIAELEPGSGPVVLSGPPGPFGVIICYEGVFPGLVRAFVRGGALFMVNMTNDAWFGRTSGPLQHLAMYPLRAVEHRVAIARVANTGVSAFIAPSGRIDERLGLFERGILRRAVPLRRGQTVYTRLGDWLVWVCLAAAAATLAWAARGARRAE